MRTFSVEIHENIVDELRNSTRPQITLDLPSVPEPGDKLWVKSMRGTHIVETEKCMILESCRVSRLRPTVRLVLLFGVTTNHGHDVSCEQTALREGRKHAPLPEVIRSIRAEQSQKELSFSRDKMARKVTLLNKLGSVINGCTTDEKEEYNAVDSAK